MMITQIGLTDRIAELEIKVSWAEDQIDALNTSAYQQMRLIEALQRDLTALRDQVSSSQPGETLSLRDELPPHY
jgi:SlyX protein